MNKVKDSFIEFISISRGLNYFFIFLNTEILGKI